jgi:hypothetical protein
MDLEKDPSHSHRLIELGVYSQNGHANVTRLRRTSRWTLLMSIPMIPEVPDSKERSGEVVAVVVARTFVGRLQRTP